MQTKEELYRAIFNPARARTKEDILADIEAWEHQIRLDEGGWQSAFARVREYLPGLLMTQGVAQAVIENVIATIDAAKLSSEEERRRIEDEIEAGY